MSLPTLDDVRTRLEDRVQTQIDENEEVNQNLTDEPTIHELIYDELRSLNSSLESIDERLVENNDLLFQIRYHLPTKSGRNNDELLNQEEINNLFNDMNATNNGQKIKKIKFSGNERHLLYQALGSRIKDIESTPPWENKSNVVNSYKDLLKKIKTSKQWNG